MKLSIIVCVYNEINTISKILEKIDLVKLPFNYEKEIIIVDNNSQDGTKEFLQKLTELDKYKIIFQEENLGKGNSIITAIDYATGDLTVFQDADLEYEPDNYIELITYLKKNNLDAVFGSRIKYHKDNFYYKLNRLAVIIFSKMINILFKGSFTDVATNHKLIKREVLQKLNLVSKGFNLDFEVSLKLAKYGYKTGKISIHYYPRKYNQGKKINFIDAIKSFLVIIYFYFKR